VGKKRLELLSLAALVSKTNALPIFCYFITFLFFIVQQFLINATSRATI
jgi:hypothetical protein